MFQDLRIRGCTSGVELALAGWDLVEALLFLLSVFVMISSALCCVDVAAVLIHF